MSESAPTEVLEPAVANRDLGDFGGRRDRGDQPPDGHPVTGVADSASSDGGADDRELVSPPVGRAASPVGRRLARVGGMRPDLVDEFPAERRDFTQMAFVLFTTATMAVVSGAFAINMAFLREVTIPGGPTVYEGPPVAVSIAFGLVWGLVIFNIDRYMVLGMEGLHHTATLVPALLRVALAALIGVVMSTPLVLQIFSTEIQVEMLKMQQEGILDSTDNIGAMREQLKQLDAQIATTQAALTLAQGGVDPEGKSSYEAAVKAFMTAGAACTAAETRAELELRGDLPRTAGGSGSRGGGSVWLALDGERERLCGIRDDRKGAMDIAAGNKALPDDEKASRIASEESTLKGLRQQRADLIADIEGARGPAEGIAKGSFGLITRLLALERLTAPSDAAVPEPTTSASPTTSAAPPEGTTASPSTETASATGATLVEQDSARLARLGHWSILGLLTAIEILPVLFKTIKQWPPEPTPYECRWRDVDTATVLRTREVESRAMDATRLEAFAPVAAAEHMQRMQQQVNELLNREIAEVQLQLMQKSLGEWAAGHGVDYAPSRFTPGPDPRPAPPDPAPADGRTGPTADGAQHTPASPTPQAAPETAAEGQAYLNS